jgi:hypothetical protein
MPKKPVSGGASSKYGTSVWVATAIHELIGEVAASEERATQTVLRRAIQAYADASEDYQRWLKRNKGSRKVTTNEPTHPTDDERAPAAAAGPARAVGRRAADDRAAAGYRGSAERAT